MNSPAIEELERGRTEIIEPKAHLSEGEERTEEMSSPVPKESWQRPLPTAADSSAPEARVEADAEYFFTFERFFLRWVQSSPSSSDGLKTESVAGRICKPDSLSC